MQALKQKIVEIHNPVPINELMLPETGETFQKQMNWWMAGKRSRTIQDLKKFWLKHVWDRSAWVQQSK